MQASGKLFGSFLLLVVPKTPAALQAMLGFRSAHLMSGPTHKLLNLAA
jgi:hypothetical protein